MGESLIVDAAVLAHRPVLINFPKPVELQVERAPFMLTISYCKISSLF